MRGTAPIISCMTMAAAPEKPIPRLPGGRPFVGHLGTFQKDRIGMMLRLARSHPELVQLRIGIIPRFVVVSSPTLLNEALVTKVASYVKAPGLAVFLRPVLGDGLLTSEHAAHARQRKLLAPVFTPKRIAGYAATMAERTQRFAERLTHGEVVDLSDAMMRLTFDIVGKALFDAEVSSDADAVGEAITTAMKVAMMQLQSFVPVPPFVPTPNNLRYRRAVGQLDEVIYRIIDERRAAGGDRGDVLSVLLETRDETGAGMSDLQVRDEAMTLFLAGHETTANALAWTFYLLAKNPDVRERLEAEVDALGAPPTYEDLKRLPYALAVFKEAMRLYPPAYVLARRTIEDTALGGHILKKNTIVILNVIGMHRRPDLFPDPDRFDPTRFERELPRGAYLPFGAGPRVCIGNHFATMEGHLLLATLARTVRFDLRSGVEAALEPLVTLRPKDGVLATIARR